MSSRIHKPRTYSKHGAIEKTQHRQPLRILRHHPSASLAHFFPFQLKNCPTMDRAESQFSLHDLVSACEPVHKSGRPSDNDEWIPISTRRRIVCRPWIRDRNCQSRLLPACQSEKVAKCSKKAERIFKVWKSGALLPEAVFVPRFAFFGLRCVDF